GRWPLELPTPLGVRWDVATLRAGQTTESGTRHRCSSDQSATQTKEPCDALMEPSIMAKPVERERAIELRRHGLSYREIRAQVPVAKSTLSLWLRQVGLANAQRQRLADAGWPGRIAGAKNVTSSVWHVSQLFTIPQFRRRRG